jgi:hypothetical protein
VPPSILESLVLGEAAVGLVGFACPDCVRKVDEGRGADHGPGCISWWFWEAGGNQRATPDEALHEVARYLARRGR